MASNYETGFLPQAPARNMSLVRHDKIPEGAEILCVTGRPLCAHLATAALKKLVKFNEAYNATESTPLDEIANLKVDSKYDLVIASHRLFVYHAVPKVFDRVGMSYAALAGCGETVAYLAMIARLMAEQNQTSSFDEDEYQRIAKRSLPTLLSIARTSNEADGALTRAMMNWSLAETRDMEDEDIYGNLELDASFFDIDNEGGVKLKNDPETLKRYKDQDGTVFDFSDNYRSVLFGCPFRSKIPLMFKPMTTAMINNGLAEQEYYRASIEKSGDVQ